MAGLDGSSIVDSTYAMNFLLIPVLVVALLCATSGASAVVAKGAAAPSANRVNAQRLQLAWFNSLDRSFSLAAVEGTVKITVHSTSGAQLNVVHNGPIGARDILQVSEDLPPGVYVLCIRQDQKLTLERITLF
jgi:hypothetical protein